MHRVIVSAYADTIIPPLLEQRRPAGRRMRRVQQARPALRYGAAVPLRAR